MHFYISKQEIKIHEKMSVNKTSQAHKSGSAFLQDLPSRIIIKNNLSTDFHFVFYLNTARIHLISYNGLKAVLI